MGAPDGSTAEADGAGSDVKLYRGILEEMVRGLPREHQTGGVRTLVERLRSIYQNAGVNPPEWLDKVLPPGERPGAPQT